MSDPVSISFHGAARTVTGSKHLLDAAGSRVLLDAGLFQGLKELRLLNWRKPPFDPRSIDRVVLSHTHIDHVGWLPRLVKAGMRCPVHLTPAAFELAELMLLDSAKLQEEDARYANRKKFSKHDPAKPLYTTRDAKAALKLRRKERYARWFDLDRKGRIRAQFHNAGHLLGSSFVQLEIARDGKSPLRVVYSGDIGRYDLLLHPDPRPLPRCDVLICESTYGDRRHSRRTFEQQAGPALRKTLRAGGTVLVPAFAVGRSQQVTLILRTLMREQKIPEVPIHIDSPMAVNATRIYSRFLDRKNVDPDVFEDGRLRLFPKNVHLHRKVHESKALNDARGPRIIISSSGMLTGGRVLHHLRRLAPRPENLLMLIGYQAAGTRGRDLLEGSDTVKVHGSHVPVRAKVLSIEGLSGHADREELLRWIGTAPEPPRRVFLVHGEADASRSLAKAIRKRFGSECERPELDQRFGL